MTSHQYRFGKRERLKHRKLIQRVFAEGRSRGKYPLRLIWLSVNDDEETPDFQVGFTVPKRTFRQAWKRNLLKRRMREAYRLNKHLIVSRGFPAQQRYAMFFIYTAKEEHSFANISTSLKVLLERFAKDELIRTSGRLE